MKRTKMLCAVTSVLMAVLLIALSVSAPIDALDTITTSNQNKIDSVLREKMAEASGNEKIPVAIWYSDVDQDNIDKLTAQKVGFTRDDVAVAYEMPSTELLASLEKEESGAADEMQAYLKRTESLRKLERERTDEYIMTRREFSRSKYNEKSAKLIKDVDIKSEDITFQSQYAPMIIANLFIKQIENLKANLMVENITYYEELQFVSDSIESALEVSNINKIVEYSGLGMTGDGVKVGIIENHSVRISEYEESRLHIVPDNCIPTVRITADNVQMTDYGNVVVVGNTVYDSEDTHVDKVANSLLSVAPNIILYSSNMQYSNIEGMISEGVSIISCSLGPYTPEDNDYYGYTDFEKWIDHLVSKHAVTITKSAGNQGHRTSDFTYTVVEDGITKTKNGYGPRVSSPGLAYNVITVGAYCDVPDAYSYYDYESGTNDVISVYHGADTLYVYSSYKNSITREDGTIIYGCEKPDVIAPATFNGRGTSNATPFMAGMITLMYELKPSLASYPQATKAIVLASCHKKVNQVAGYGATETLQEGITDRQGAGAPDAWTMASIVCNGTYGVGRIKGTNTQALRRFVMPSYGASNMNVSLTWLREGTFVDEQGNALTDPNHTTDTLQAGTAVNLNLSVFRNGTQVGLSNLEHSSTEMAYFNVNNTNWDYEIRINKATTSYTGTVRYGYAYSLDEMIMEPPTDEGIYYIRNYLTDKYLTLDTATDETTLQYFASTSAGRQPQMWVLKGTQGDYELLPAYGSVGEKLNFGAQVGTNPYYKAVLGTNDLNLSLTSWEYDTTLEPDAHIFTSTSEGSNNILSYTSSTGIFVRSTTAPVVNMYRMWVLEDVNYRRGDTTLDGDININDATAIQKHLGGLEELNNMQFYLADYNADGVVNIKDTTAIQNYVGGI